MAGVCQAFRRGDSGRSGQAAADLQVLSQTCQAPRSDHRSTFPGHAGFPRHQAALLLRCQEMQRVSYPFAWVPNGPERTLRHPDSPSFPKCALRNIIMENQGTRITYAAQGGHSVILAPPIGAKGTSYVEFHLQNIGRYPYIFVGVNDGTHDVHGEWGASTDPHAHLYFCLNGSKLHDGFGPSDDSARSSLPNKNTTHARSWKSSSDHLCTSATLLRPFNPIPPPPFQSHPSPSHLHRALLFPPVSSQHCPALHRTA